MDALVHERGRDRSPRLIPYTARAPPLLLVGHLALLRDVPARRPRTTGLEFAEKVRVWLMRNAKEGRQPDSPKALAEALGETHPRIYRVMKGQDPKLALALKIARAMGESLDFLADTDLDFKDRSPQSRWESFVSTLRPDERGAIAEALSRSSEIRRLLLAYAEKGWPHSGAAASSPTEPRR